MVGNPSLRESVKLVLLCLGVIFWCVAHVNPVDQKLLDLVAGEVRILFMDALNGLLKIEPVGIRPDELASSCTSFSRSSRVSHISVHSSPSGESVQSDNSSIKGLFTNNIIFRMFLTPLAHEVSPHIDRGLRGPFCLHAAALAQGYPCCRQGAGTLVASDFRNADRRHAGAQ